MLFLSVSSRGLTREGSRREIHLLGEKNTESKACMHAIESVKSIMHFCVHHSDDYSVSPVSYDALALQQSFEDMSKYDFDPKLCASKLLPT